MKYVIINADDFGYSKGINKGILEALNRNAITSTSVMVYGNAADETLKLGDIRNISVGLHLHMEKAIPNAQHEFDTQIRIFKELLGRMPDHIDVHRPRSSDMKQIRPLLEEYSKVNNVPVRELGHAVSIKEFFGIDVKDNKEVDPERVSVKNLIRILENLEDGVSEIMTHIGYSDDELRGLNSYSDLREVELKTLTSFEVREYISNKDNLKLVSWNDAPIVFS
jgi:predicted glycoside hydrolase/deacetylase ChbG (UPF0249 family)